MTIYQELGYSPEEVDIAALWKTADTLPSPPHRWNLGATLRMRYAEDGRVQATYKEMAALNSVTPSRVRQVVKKACRMLRGPRYVHRWQKVVDG